MNAPPPVRLLTLLVLALSLPSQVFGQETLRGTVVDSTAHGALIGANVYLVGTALGAATDREGEFRIAKVPAGTYTLRITYLGYHTREIPVTVGVDPYPPLRISLLQSMVEGEEVTVTAQARGQVSAINQQISSATIVNVVSEERIQELPDANAAEAIGRLPGVSITRSGGEANKVILRGLSDKFSTFTLDGIRIAPTEADDRGVDLSTMSQSSLAGVELYKALTPDKDADAIAGSVNLVTRKAPMERTVRVDARGAYNHLNNTLNQYLFDLRYGERFFDGVLGVQATGNLEQRDRSNERLNLDYNLNLNGQNTDYKISDAGLIYTDEMRKRGGAGLLLDVNTPDSGFVKISNIYSATTRDYIVYSRNYPTDGTTELLYSARDRTQDIRTFNSSLTGQNYFLGLTSTWGISFAQSSGEYPYDYSMTLRESSILDDSGNVISGMRNIPESLWKGPAEAFIPYAANNFYLAYADTGYSRFEKNLDREKTAFLDLKTDYSLGDQFAGHLKLGAKYRSKARFKESSELVAPYYNMAWPRYRLMSDGSMQLKPLDPILVNTRVSMENFLGSPVASRDIYSKYLLNPLLDRTALRQWHDLNIDGIGDAGEREYRPNYETATDYYDITERVASAYVMHTLDVGRNITFIAGLRVESERNDYSSRYSPEMLSGFPSGTSGSIKDTSTSYTETVWLPNFHLTFRPSDFMSVRLAAYRALARPDFNARLLKFVSRQATPGVLTVSNPELQDAKAWNYEVNTSFYGSGIGLLSISAFYKEITDMYHTINSVRLSGQRILDSLGIHWQDPFHGGDYNLTYPYNSSQPTRIWGIEIEHQANLGFLPGFLQNLVLNYNLTVLRSETHLLRSQVVKGYKVVPPFPFPIETSWNILVDSKEKLEAQPELFGNLALGYDIGGFSARISVFYQGEYNTVLSGDGRSDQVQQSYVRWDFAARQKITDFLSVMLSVNNLTNVEEGDYIDNRIQNWNLADTSEKYGLTAEVGLRFTL
jgi:TonB-dependent receptor